MTFIDYVAITGWAIVTVQNGFGVVRWVVAKIREGKAAVK